jgi:hypothetical protein
MSERKGRSRFAWLLLLAAFAMVLAVACGRRR